MMSDVWAEEKKRRQRQKQFQRQMTRINGAICGTIGLCVLAVIALFWKVGPVFEDNFFIALFTIFLGGGAIIQGLFLYKQDVSLRLSFDDTRESNELQQRAFLSLDYNPDIGLKFIRNGSVHVDISNVGKTPASTVVVQAAVSTEKSYVVKEDEDEFKPGHYGDVSFTSAVKAFIEKLVVDKESIFLSEPLAVGELFPNKNVLQQVVLRGIDAKSTKDFLVCVFVTYYDIFGKKRYTTVTCKLEFHGSERGRIETRVAYGAGLA